MEKKLRRDAQTFFAVCLLDHSPSLISQGKIGQLVTAKPVDRRAILEEARASRVYMLDDMKQRRIECCRK